jgi:hypothetical protein
MSRALLLVGSPKSEQSASRSFGEAITTRLQAHGWETSAERIKPTFRSSERMEALLEEIERADLVVLSFPLYVDTVPAPVMRVLEKWADRGVRRGQRIAVLAQCGFPEAYHIDPAIETCRRFAAEVGLEWAGHLAFGMGGSIEGRPPEQSPLARRVHLFDSAAEALAGGAAIPRAATDAFKKPVVPPWAYPAFGQVMWRMEARRRGCVEPLTLRRYAQ